MTQDLNNIVVHGNDIQVFYSPQQYKHQLLSLIASARERIYITALYVQDDEAGREVLEALYQAKENYPQLDIKIFVDFHRAQRGLIGEKASLGNRALYLELEKTKSQRIDIYGIAIKSKEVFGVLHLKGMVFDNHVFYTGASINNVYFQQQGKYRLDRYYQILSPELSNAFCDFLTTTFLDSELAPRLNSEIIPTKLEQKILIQQLKVAVRTAQYHIQKTDLAIEEAFDENSLKGNIAITPIAGNGPRNNPLNNTICQLIRNTQSTMVIFTPYFNFPKPLTKEVNKALKRGVKVTLIIGDKTANDFFIPEDQAFTTIGIVPYLYEVLLARFVKLQKKYIENGQLLIKIWKDGDNSFHPKGIVADDRYHLITGSNLNPRAWSLDLENALLLDDPQQFLMPAFEQEWQNVIKNTKPIIHADQIDTIKDYPIKPRKLLQKLRMVQIDKILKRLL